MAKSRAVTDDSEKCTDFVMDTILGGNLTIMLYFRYSNNKAVLIPVTNRREREREKQQCAPIKPATLLAGMLIDHNL